MYYHVPVNKKKEVFMNNSITVTVGGKQLSYSPDDGMLSAWAEKNNVPIETHCKEGFCGACVCGVSADDELDRNKLVSTTDDAIAYAGDNEIVSCQSMPLRDITLTLR